MAEGAHQLTFPHELSRNPMQVGSLEFMAVLKEVVDRFGGANGSWYSHLLHTSVGSGADHDACWSHVGEHERPQLRIIAKKEFSSHHERALRQERRRRGWTAVSRASYVSGGLAWVWVFLGTGFGRVQSDCRISLVAQVACDA